MFGAFRQFGKLGAVGGTRSLIAQLFPSGTSGFASGLSITEAYQKGYLFQDSEGTTPAAIESPVGLVLDASQGLVLGPELVPASYTGTTDAPWAISATSITRNGATAGIAIFNLVAPISTSKKYRVSGTVSGLSGDTFGICVGPGGTAYNVTSNGDFVINAPGSANGASFYIICWSGGVGQATITNISVRELPGNHATQPTSTKRPTLSARVNVCLDTETHTVGTLGDAAGTTPPTIAVGSYGGMACEAITLPAGATGYSASRREGAGGSKAGRWVMAANTTYQASVVCALSRALGPGESINIFQTGASGGWDIFITSTTQNQTTMTRRSSASYSSGSNSGVAGSYVYSAGTALASPVTVYITKFDVRPADTPASLPAYQRVNTATDYDTVGFPHYLVFDGVDDCLATPSIDMTSTDKATVFAGVRKLSSTVAIMWEFSNDANTNPGSLFGASGVDHVLDNYEVVSAGSGRGAGASLLASTSAYPAPHSAVITSTHSISSNLSTIRVNGVAGTDATEPQGSGNFGNYPLYIGMRGGASLPFNGRMYTLPIIVGRAVEPALIASVESSINASMGGIY